MIKKTEKCGDCLFWHHTQHHHSLEQKAVADFEPYGTLIVDSEGECRRFPPVLSVDVLREYAGEDGCDAAQPLTRSYVWHFPVIVASDWCGEFKPNESERE